MLKWLFGGGKKRARTGQSDRSERNAIIRRVVAAAAKTGNKNQEAQAQFIESKTPPPSVAIGPLTLSSAVLNSSSSGNIPQDQVAERAYQIWVRNGRPTGTADLDWAQAVAELSSTASATT